MWGFNTWKVTLVIFESKMEISHMDLASHSVLCTKGVFQQLLKRSFAHLPRSMVLLKLLFHCIIQTNLHLQSIWRTVVSNVVQGINGIKYMNSTFTRQRLVKTLCWKHACIKMQCNKGKNNLVAKRSAFPINLNKLNHCVCMYVQYACVIYKYRYI